MSVCVRCNGLGYLISRSVPCKRCDGTGVDPVHASAKSAVTELRDAGDFLVQAGPTEGAVRRWERAKAAL